MQNFLRVVMTFKKNVHLVFIPKKKENEGFYPLKSEKERIKHDKFYAGFGPDKVKQQACIQLKQCNKSQS